MLLWHWGQAVWINTNHFPAGVIPQGQAGSCPAAEGLRWHSPCYPPALHPFLTLGFCTPPCQNTPCPGWAGGLAWACQGAAPMLQSSCALRHPTGVSSEGVHPEEGTPPHWGTLGSRGIW